MTSCSMPWPRDDRGCGNRRPAASLAACRLPLSSPQVPARAVRCISAVAAATGALPRAGSRRASRGASCRRPTGARMATSGGASARVSCRSVRRPPRRPPASVRGARVGVGQHTVGYVHASYAETVCTRSDFCVSAWCRLNMSYSANRNRLVSVRASRRTYDGCMVCVKSEHRDVLGSVL